MRFSFSSVDPRFPGIQAPRERVSRDRSQSERPLTMTDLKIRLDHLTSITAAEQVHRYAVRLENPALARAAVMRMSELRQAGQPRPQLTAADAAAPAQFITAVEFLLAAYETGKSLAKGRNYTADRVRQMIRRRGYVGAIEATVINSGRDTSTGFEFLIANELVHASAESTSGIAAGFRNELILSLIESCASSTATVTYTVANRTARAMHKPPLSQNDHRCCKSLAECVKMRTQAGTTKD
jgi:hypothetical protein